MPPSVKTLPYFCRGVGADSNWSPDVVEDNPGIRERAREACNFFDLWMIRATRRRRGQDGFVPQTLRETSDRTAGGARHSGHWNLPIAITLLFGIHRRGPNLGTQPKKPYIWCGEGDLNPHEI